MRIICDDHVTAILFQTFTGAEGKGYGTEAVKRMIQYARDSGRYHGIFLLCNPDNVKARQIYDKLGFQPTGEICYGDVQMRLELP